MTRAELRHLFERYWRAKRSASTQGRGLGLFISKRLVEAQGGAITVESELGVGTTACFTLPQGTRPQLPRREARAAVLVVEDEDGLRDVLQDLLLDNAYDVTAVPNGRLALEALRSGRLQYSLILLDVRLPEMDGRELLQHLREDPAFAAIPVVLVSGVEPLEELLRLGTAGCLKKPLDFNTVLAMVGTTAQPRP
jgi:CheY-like chemotaxis protein